jgi:hypothetical protein
MPKFDLQEIEDYYTYYVIIMGIPESLFWNEDLRFVDRVLINKASYDQWLNYEMQREKKRRNGK